MKIRKITYECDRCGFEVEENKHDELKPIKVAKSKYELCTSCLLELSAWLSRNGRNGN